MSFSLSTPPKSTSKFGKAAAPLHAAPHSTACPRRRQRSWPCAFGPRWADGVRVR